MRPYVRAIARFFGSDRIALALLTPAERQQLRDEAVPPLDEQIDRCLGIA